MSDTTYEQARRDFMRDNPDLYEYIRSRISARVMNEAGDLVSGATTGHSAANRCYAAASRHSARIEGDHRD